MTIQELYANIGGDYEQALRVLRMDKLINKHICKLPKGGVVEAMLAAGETMDPAAMFDTAHAVKGICANLGLVELAAVASEISEEYRPGTGRSMTDDQVAEKLRTAGELYRKAVDGIREYEAAQ